MDDVTFEIVDAVDDGPHAVHMVNDVAHDTSELPRSAPDVGDSFEYSSEHLLRPEVHPIPVATALVSPPR